VERNVSLRREIKLKFCVKKNESGDAAQFERHSDSTKPNTALHFNLCHSPSQSTSDSNANHIVGATKVFLALQYSMNDVLLHSTEIRDHAQ
jgi:hypothetical protein